MKIEVDVEVEVEAACVEDECEVGAEDECEVGVGDEVGGNGLDVELEMGGLVDHPPQRKPQKSDIWRWPWPQGATARHHVPNCFAIGGWWVGVWGGGWACVGAVGGRVGW